MTCFSSRLYLYEITSVSQFSWFDYIIDNALEGIHEMNQPRWLRDDTGLR